MSYLQDLRTDPANKPIMAVSNILSSATMSSSGAASGFSATAARTYQTYEGWRPSLSTGTLTATKSPSAAADYVGIFVVSPDPFATITIAINGATIGSVSSAAGAMLWLFDEVVISSLVITVSGLGTGYIANVMAGMRTELQRKIYVGHTPITFGRSTTKVSGVSERGQYLGTILRRRTLGTSVSMNNITPEYYRQTIDPAFVLLETQPMYFSWRQIILQEQVVPATESNNLLTELSDNILAENNDNITVGASPALAGTGEVGYAWMSGDANVSNQRSNGMMNINFSLSGLDGRI